MTYEEIGNGASILNQIKNGNLICVKKKLRNLIIIEKPIMAAVLKSEAYRFMLSEHKELINKINEDNSTTIKYTEGNSTVIQSIDAFFKSYNPDRNYYIGTLSDAAQKQTQPAKEIDNLSREELEEFFVLNSKNKEKAKDFVNKIKIITKEYYKETYCQASIVNKILLDKLGMQFIKAYNVSQHLYFVIMDGVVSPLSADEFAKVNGHKCLYNFEGMLVKTEQLTAKPTSKTHVKYNVNLQIAKIGLNSTVFTDGGFMIPIEECELEKSFKIAGNYIIPETIKFYLSTIEKNYKDLDEKNSSDEPEGKAEESDEADKADEADEANTETVEEPEMKVYKLPVKIMYGATEKDMHNIIEEYYIHDEIAVNEAEASASYIVTKSSEFGTHHIVVRDLSGDSKTPLISSSGDKLKDVYQKVYNIFYDKILKV